jgi:hypothetical protein
VSDRATGDVEHLVLGTSLPWLLPHAIGDLQSISQIAAARPGWRGRLGETIRQAGDLEHWQAFRSSFDRLTQMVTAAATGPDAPVSISVLSGDVHHSYAAQVDLPGSGDAPGRGASAVHQLTCSPVHNVVDWFIRPGFRLGWSRTIARATRWWAGRAGVPPLEVTWHRLAGPLFGNTVATLDLDGRHAEVTFLQPRSAGTMREAAQLVLADGPPAGSTPDVAVVTGTSSTGRPQVG